MAQKCPYCGSELPEESRFCMSCMQYTVPPEALAFDTADGSNKNSHRRILLPLVLLLIFAASAIGILHLKNTDKPVAENPSASVAAVTEETGSTTVSDETVVSDTTNETVTGDTTSTTTPLQSETAPSSSPTPAGTTASGSGGNSAGSSDNTTTATTKAATQGTTKKATTTTEKKITSSQTEEAEKIVISSGILKHYPATATNTHYTIPHSVTKIADNAFSGNKYITSLEFSSRENLDCNYANLFNSLPNLNTIYIYPGTSPDLEGKQYFWGKVVYL